MFLLNMANVSHNVVKLRTDEDKVISEGSEQHLFKVVLNVTNSWTLCVRANLQKPSMFLFEGGLVVHTHLCRFCLSATLLRADLADVQRGIQRLPAFFSPVRAGLWVLAASKNRPQIGERRVKVVNTGLRSVHQKPVPAETECICCVDANKHTTDEMLLKHHDSDSIWYCGKQRLYVWLFETSSFMSPDEKRQKSKEVNKPVFNGQLVIKWAHYLLMRLISSKIVWLTLGLIFFIQLGSVTDTHCNVLANVCHCTIYGFHVL